MTKVMVFNEPLTGLNWFQTFESLGREFRVLAPDLRGHARGLRARRFHLEDCADDVAAPQRGVRHRLPGVAGVEEQHRLAGQIAQRAPDIILRHAAHAPSTRWPPR